MKFGFQRHDAQTRTERAIMMGGLLVFVLLLLGSTFAPAFAVPRCHFKYFTGFPCGGCGTFRGLSELTELNLQAALRSQPLMMTLFLGLCGYALHAACAHVLRAPVLVIQNWSRKDTWRTLAIFAMLFVGNWVFLIADGR